MMEGDEALWDAEVPIEMDDFTDSRIQERDALLTPTMLSYHPDTHLVFFFLRLFGLYHRPKDNFLVKYCYPLLIFLVLCLPIVIEPLGFVFMMKDLDDTRFNVLILIGLLFYAIPPCMYAFSYWYFSNSHFENILCLFLHGEYQRDTHAILSTHVVWGNALILAYWLVSVVFFFMSGVADQFLFETEGTIAFGLSLIYACFGFLTFNVVIQPISACSIVLHLLLLDIRAFNILLRRQDLAVEDIRQRHRTLRDLLAAVSSQWQWSYVIVGGFGTLGTLLSFYELLYDTTGVLTWSNIAYGCFLLLVFLPLVGYAFSLPAMVSEECSNIIRNASTYYCSSSDNTIERISLLMEFVHNRAAFQILGFRVTFNFLLQVVFVFISGAMFILQNKVGKLFQ